MLNQTAQIWITVAASLTGVSAATAAYILHHKEKEYIKNLKEKMNIFPSRDNFDQVSIKSEKADIELDNNEDLHFKFKLISGAIGDDQMIADSNVGRASVFNLGYTKAKRRSFKEKNWKEMGFDRVYLTSKRIIFDAESNYKNVMVKSIKGIRYVDVNTILIASTNLNKIKIELESFEECTRFANAVYSLKEILVNQKPYQTEFNKFRKLHTKVELIDLCREHGVLYLNSDKKEELIHRLLSSGIFSKRKNNYQKK